VNGDELLARLARHDEHDRAWLLGELPPAMRRELVAVLADEVAEQPSVGSAPAAGWESLDPIAVAHVLAAEPAWLVSSAIRGTEPRWRERLLSAAAPRRRHEIELADRAGRPLGARSGKLLLDACRARVAEGLGSQGGEQRSRFAELVDRMRSRFA
jgi:hypothetical protein